MRLEEDLRSSRSGHSWSGWLGVTGVVIATIVAANRPVGNGVAAVQKSQASGLTSRDAGLISLPPGFQYRVVADESTIYSDGTPRPGDADGMGAFPGPNNTTLLCVNHELTNGEPPVVPPVNDHYDPTSSGGTSVMLVGANRKLKQAWVSSSGTNRNCAGAVTPWGTWITVEENLAKSGSYTHGWAFEVDPYAPLDGLAKSGSYTHGWAFEVDPYAPLDGGVPRQIRLDKLGRFYKEAATVDPDTGAVYQTEDQWNSLYYQFLPAAGTQPSGFGAYVDAPGILQALYLPELPNANAASQGDVYYPQWVAVPDPDGDPTPTRYQAYLDANSVVVQPTRFYRGEGSWWSDVEDAVYFDCTGGGSSGHRGQIWRYEPGANELTLVFRSTNANVLDKPDNLLVLPWGDVLLCEDGSGLNYLRILKLDGQMIDFASTNVSEFAGACWSSSPDTLFVNLQSPSITLAIWGPWPQLKK